MYVRVGVYMYVCMVCMLVYTRYVYNVNVRCVTRRSNLARAHSHTVVIATAFALDAHAPKASFCPSDI